MDNFYQGPSEEHEFDSVIQYRGSGMWTFEDLERNTNYYFRAYISNGLSRYYSNTIKVRTPDISRASISNVSTRDGYFTAQVKDNGGREIVEVGFLIADVNGLDLEQLKEGKKYKGRAIENNYWVLPIHICSPDRRHACLAYVLDDRGEYSYSPNVTEVLIDGGDKIIMDNISYSAQRYLLDNFDSNFDGIITYREIDKVSDLTVDVDILSEISEIDFCYYNVTRLSIVCSNDSLVVPLRLECFNALKQLYIKGSANMMSLDLSGMTTLTNMSCFGCGISSLIISGCKSLKELNCSYNKLTSLDCSGCYALETLYCHSNALQNLDISDCGALDLLSCMDNLLTSLDLSNNSILSYVTCAWCPYLSEIWLNRGQSFGYFSYDTSIATIKYKD